MEMDERHLDRHFEMQLPVAKKFYKNVTQSDLGIAKSWVKVFQRAQPGEKFARNCLMLYMCDQLAEGQLGRPFANVDNVSRKLDDVLNEHNAKESKTRLGQQEELRVEYYRQLQMQKLDREQVELQAILDKLEQIDQDQKQEERRQKWQQENPDWHRYVPDNAVAEDSLEGEQCFPFDELLTLFQPKQPLPRTSQKLQIVDLESHTLLAIDHLKDWTAASGPLNFLSTSMQSILGQDPEAKKLLSDLDRRLEYVLDDLMEQAGQRCDQNVRILYDQMFRQQKQVLQQKEKQLRREKASICKARKLLQLVVQDLNERERDMWQQHSKELHCKNTLKSKSSDGVSLCLGCSECESDEEPAQNPTLEPDIPSGFN